MKKNLTKFISLIMLIAIVSTTACDNTEFRKQIGEFQTAMSESQIAIQTYYVEINQFERDIVSLRRELDPTLPLGVKFGLEKPADGRVAQIDENSLYVNAPFSPESIQARLDALKLISLYGKRLAELAGTDSPTVFETNVDALGTNIVNLDKTFQKLANSGTDKSALAFVGPISKLVGMVGRLFLERKRDKELIAAIREATPQITDITSKLKTDFDEVFNATRTTGLIDSLSAMTLFYEKNKATMKREERKKVLAEINGIIRIYELFVSANPSDIVQSMEDANQALLAYANSGRKDGDFIQVVAHIGEFRDNARQIVEAIQEIREIRRSLRDAN
ncbi:hypothetical protein BH10ACI1_BH10ACI1_33980 [soil metagenome]